MNADQVPESLVDEFRTHGAHGDVTDDLSRAEIREGIAAVLTMWERLRRKPGSLAAELAKAESREAAVKRIIIIPVTERTLMRLWWVDATNQAGGWHDAETLGEFATNGAWEASNTGWLVYEDDHCYVLAGRMTDDGEHVGLVERIPKAAVTRKEMLQS